MFSNSYLEIRACGVLGGGCGSRRRGMTLGEMGGALCWSTEDMIGLVHCLVSLLEVTFHTWQPSRIRNGGESYSWCKLITVLNRLYSYSMSTVAHCGAWILSNHLNDLAPNMANQKERPLNTKQLKFPSGMFQRHQIQVQDPRSKALVMYRL